jgi:hypothetical protein
MITGVIVLSSFLVACVPMGGHYYRPSAATGKVVKEKGSSLDLIVAGWRRVLSRRGRLSRILEGRA